MPRGHEHDPVSRLELVFFYGLSLFISREKGDHYYIQTRRNDQVRPRETLLPLMRFAKLNKPPSLPSPPQKCLKK